MEDVPLSSGRRDNGAAMATMPLFQTQPPELESRRRPGASGIQETVTSDSSGARKLSASSNTASNVGSEDHESVNGGRQPSTKSSSFILPQDGKQTCCCTLHR